MRNIDFFFHLQSSKYNSKSDNIWVKTGKNTIKNVCKFEKMIFNPVVLYPLFSPITPCVDIISYQSLRSNTTQPNSIITVIFTYHRSME